MRSTRIYILAKELGVRSSDVIKKCHFEGKRLVAVKNHMSPVSDDVAVAIRMWFARRPAELDDHICTIQFAFTVNKSFVNTSTHPITVPTKYNSMLRSHIPSNRQEITLCISDYMTISGYIYYGISSWGHYYQIKIPRWEYNKIPEHYQVGQLIHVDVKVSRTIIKVYLREAG